MIAHRFVPDSWGRDVCDAVTDEGGHLRHCGRRKNEHEPSADEQSRDVDDHRGVGDHRDRRDPAYGHLDEHLGLDPQLHALALANSSTEPRAAYEKASSRKPTGDREEID